MAEQAEPPKQIGIQSNQGGDIRIDESPVIIAGRDAHVTLHQPLAKPEVDYAAAEKRYRQQVIDAYKWLDFGGFGRADWSLVGVPLEKIFVRLSLTVEKVVREMGSGERPGKQRREQEVRRVQEPIELGQALVSHVLVVGEPGAGKSTLLRWLAVTFASGCQREEGRLGLLADADRVPMLVELGRLPDRYLKGEGGEAPNWLEFLPWYLASQMAFTRTPPEVLSRVLHEGRALVLFDGLDEVADRQARGRLVRSLGELARFAPGNKVVIGSRPAGVGESEAVLHAQFRRCQIERLTQEDVRRFFGFWYALDEGLTAEQQREGAQALFERVRASAATLQLATTPLLSAVLLLLWRNEGELPERRVELYEHCCRVLIEQWEAAHEVAHKGALARMDWQGYVRVLAPLAYKIHSEEQRTSASRDELVPLLAEGYTDERMAEREARRFLDELGLRSGLLQYLGDDKYGFAHLTFQEYLAARSIAEQPEPEYIDLVMEHLQESWWWEVHLLTVGHLGSGKAGAGKAEALVLTMLQGDAPPSPVLLPSRHRRVRLVGPGRFLPEVQLERRIAWTLVRELELVVRASAECVREGRTTKVSNVLLARTVALVKDILSGDDAREREDLLAVIGQFLPDRERMGVIDVLLQALSAADSDVRESAIAGLGEVGVGNEAVIEALLPMLSAADTWVRRRAIESLGKVGASRDRLRQVLVDLNRCLHDSDDSVRRAALRCMRMLLDGRAIPGYRWVPLGERRARRRRFRVLMYGSGVTAVLLGGGLVAGWLFGGFDVRSSYFLLMEVLVGVMGVVAVVAFLGMRRWRDPWKM